MRVAFDAFGSRVKSHRPALFVPSSLVVQPSSYLTLGSPPMTAAHSYVPSSALPMPRTQYGPARMLGRKQGATARRELSVLLTARAQSVMLFLLVLGPFTLSLFA